MTTPFRLLGQGIPASAQGANEWRDHFFAQKDEDLDEFQRFPSARFLVRERALDEIDKNGEYDALRPGARTLVTIYRSGHRDPYYDAPGWFALSRYIWRAECALKRCPALRADAVVDQVSGLLNSVAPMVSGFVYIDAPGRIHLTADKVRILKQFNSNEVDSIWQNIIIERQKRTDRQRGFKKSRLTHYEGPPVFTLEGLKR